MTSPPLLREHADELERLVGVRIELVEAPPQVYVVLHGVPLPPVYTAPTADALLMTDMLYPRSAMDMFWLEENVGRRDGAMPLGTESLEHYLGRPWRRYSWHRHGVWSTVGNPLMDHYEFMQSRLAMEAAA